MFSAGHVRGDVKAQTKEQHQLDENARLGCRHIDWQPALQRASLDYTSTRYRFFYSRPAGTGARGSGASGSAR